MSLAESQDYQIMLPKTSTSSSEADSDLSLAREVAHDLPRKFTDLGATPQQADGIAEAVSLFLAKQPDYRNQAAEALMRAGFRNGTVIILLDDIAAALKA
jgi:hypothetical protein